MAKIFFTAAAILLGACLIPHAHAFESHLKMRIHKDMVQTLFTKNFDILLRKVEKEQEKDVKLDEINAQLTDVHIGIRPS